MPFFARKKRVLNFVLPLVLALIFFSLSFNKRKASSWYEGAFLNLITPLQIAFSYTSNHIGDHLHTFLYLLHAGRENKRIQKDNSFLKTEIIRLKELKQENERLKSLLDYKESLSFTTIVARVIGNEPRSEFKSIIIDKGNKDGVELLMPVVGAKGLVGRIEKLNSNSATVLLITDPNSAVDVMVQRSRARALLIGTSHRTELKAGNYISRLEYLERTSDITDDDIIVTSGFDRIYPSGVPVGTLYNIEQTEYGIFKQAEVLPYENFAEIEEVMVILKKAKEVE